MKTTRHIDYYKITQVYKKLIDKKTKAGKDSMRLKKRLLTIMNNGENKSAYSL